MLFNIRLENILLFNVRLENIFSHMEASPLWWRTAKFCPMFSTYGLWAVPKGFLVIELLSISQLCLNKNTEWSDSPLFTSIHNLIHCIPFFDLVFVCVFLYRNSFKSICSIYSRSISYHKSLYRYTESDLIWGSPHCKIVHVIWCTYMQ